MDELVRVDLNESALEDRVEIFKFYILSQIEVKNKKSFESKNFHLYIDMRLNVPLRLFFIYNYIFLTAYPV